MTRETPIGILLWHRTQAARERRAEKVLDPLAIGETVGESAGKGLAYHVVALGDACLKDTKAAKRLEAHLAGCTLEWIQQEDAERRERWFLRISWPSDVTALRHHNV